MNRFAPYAPDYCIRGTPLCRVFALNFALLIQHMSDAWLMCRYCLMSPTVNKWYQHGSIAVAYTVRTPFTAG
ncbi:MAG TPA: hypothetical protein ACQGQH_09905 [Xylella sp.]